MITSLVSPFSTENFDTALIRALRMSPRASISTLATMTGQSRHSVSTRLHELLATEELRIVGAVNPDFAELKVMALVFVAARGPVRELAELAASRDGVVFVAAVSGDYDFVMEVRARSHDELYNLLGFYRSIPEITKLSTNVFSRIRHGAVPHESYDPIAIDSIDRVIVNCLQRDGRSKLNTLADTVGLSPSATKARLERLLNARVLRLAVIEARRQHGARIATGIGFRLGAGADDFIQALPEHESVEYVVECVGEYDVIGTLSANSPPELFEALEQLRAEPAVLATSTWTRFHTIKEDYTHLL